MLTKQERIKLDAIFKSFQEFAERGWNIAQEADHWHHGYVFIRRGPLLLFGKWRYMGMFVITPFHANVTKVEVVDASGFNIQVTCEAGAEAVRIFDEEQGPWWEFLRQEIEATEIWIKNLVEQHNQRSNRADALNRARLAVSQVLDFARRVGS